MTDREWIEDFIGKQEKIRDRNFRNFQDSGESRYDRAYRKADELIDLATMALNVADIKSKEVSYRSAICDFGTQAMDILHYGIDSDPNAVEALLRSIKAYATMMNIVRDKWA